MSLILLEGSLGWPGQLPDEARIALAIPGGWPATETRMREILGEYHGQLSMETATGPRGREVALLQQQLEAARARVATIQARAGELAATRAKLLEDAPADLAERIAALSKEQGQTSAALKDAVDIAENFRRRLVTAQKQLQNEWAGLAGKRRESTVAAIMARRAALLKTFVEETVREAAALNCALLAVKMDSLAALSAEWQSLLMPPDPPAETDHTIVYVHPEKPSSSGAKLTWEKDPDFKPFKDDDLRLQPGDEVIEEGAGVR